MEMLIIDTIIGRCSCTGGLTLPLTKCASLHLDVRQRGFICLSLSPLSQKLSHQQPEAEEAQSLPTQTHFTLFKSNNTIIHSQEPVAASKIAYSLE